MTYTKKELKNYLKRLLKDQTGLDNFSFEYQSGHTAFHTRLRILITSTKIEQQRIPRGIEVGSPEEANAAKVHETEFSIENLSTFVELLLKKKIWDLENCTDRALPDTAQLTFTIRENDNIVFTQKVWQNCRNDDDRTKDLIRAIASLIPMNWSPP
ncbi:MAG: hypothetical protein ACFFF4_14900 [Candidatus Thorarchaeota archaeon]